MNKTIKYLALILLLVAGCQNQDEVVYRRGPTCASGVTWTEAHTRIFLELKLNHEWETCPYKNIKPDQE